MKWIILITSIGVLLTIVFFLYFRIPRHEPQTPTEIITPLEETVGQRFIWGITGTTISSESAHIISDTHAGGVILMGELTNTDIASLTAQIQTIPHTLPFIIAIDQEGGTVKRMIDDDNPGGIVLGKYDDNKFCNTIASTSAKLANVGINTNFGIIGDIGWYPNAYITNRTYGNTLISVLQKTSFAIQCSKPIRTTIKHFPGHGRTLLNSHLTIPSIQTPYDEWFTSDAQPFLDAISKGIDFIMFGHLRYATIATEPASLSPFFHAFVKNQGFTGLTVTDDMGMLERSRINPIETMKQAFDAGNDIILYVTSKESPYDLYQEALLYATSSSEIYSSFQEHYNHIKQFKELKLTN
ncbi:MAG: Beta-N-acetylhexosaminidase [Microgenomates group bacterium GW2011_GWB1_40_9]|nr:MAG: Beta-N-acetylhexosaminidase [Microgenomates group bacterium GW2011_GWB1_40_9]